MKGYKIKKKKTYQNHHHYKRIIRNCKSKKCYKMKKQQIPHSWNKQYNGQQKTNNTMANRKRPKNNNIQQKTTNTMADRKQTIQWPTENKQYNGQQKANNTMANRKRQH